MAILNNPSEGQGAVGNCLGRIRLASHLEPELPHVCVKLFSITQEEEAEFGTNKEEFSRMTKGQLLVISV